MSWREPLAARSTLGARAWAWLVPGALLSLLVPAPIRMPALIVYNAALVGLFLWDRQRVLGARLEVQRAIPQRLKVRTPSPYRVELTLVRGPALRLAIEEPPVRNAEFLPDRLRVALRPGERASLEGQLTLSQHGVVALEALAVRRETRLGLCALVVQHPVGNVLRAYPERSEPRATLANLARRAQGQASVALRAPEQGGEIEHLREYVVTDSMRQIDWKASAKRRRPITRVVQPERNQTLWIVIDASRVMTLPGELRATNGVERTRFEAALDAALALAETALAQGDRVGLLVHANDLRLCVTPHAGRGHFLSLMNACLEAHARAEPLNTTELLKTLQRRAAKRCLLVLFTDLDNEGDLRELAQRAPILTRRHVSLCVSLKPERLEQRITQPVESEHDVFLRLAAISLHEQRKQLARALSAAGLPVLESGPIELSRAVIARYREAKISGRI